MSYQMPNIMYLFTLFESTSPKTNKILLIILFCQVKDHLDKAERLKEERRKQNLELELSRCKYYLSRCKYYLSRCKYLFSNIWAGANIFWQIFEQVQILEEGKIPLADISLNKFEFAVLQWIWYDQAKGPGEGGWAKETQRGRIHPRSLLSTHILMLIQ